MFSGEQILSRPGILNAWYVTEKPMEPSTRINQKERYEQIVQTAWQHYYQNIQPRVKEELKRIALCCQPLAKQTQAPNSPSDTLVEQRNQIIEELIHTCMQLAQPARRLGNLTGQTNYFYLWKTLWAEVLDESESAVLQQMQPYLPVLYGDWHRDSILKRSFNRVTKQTHRRMR